MSDALLFHDDLNAEDKEWDSAAGSSIGVAELNESQLSNLSTWQRAAVERLPAQGQRCLYNSWVVNDHQQGLVNFYGNYTCPPFRW